MNAKEIAAEKAVKYIQNNMTVGLGTGSTTFYAICHLGDMVKNGLKIKAVASSKNSEKLAQQSGISIISFQSVENIDVTIDGADAVDKSGNLIKGGGGALLREKVLAYNSKKFIIIIDSSKLVDSMKNVPLPVEIIPFAHELTIKNLSNLNCEVSLRKKENDLFFSDNGNLIVDCKFNFIKNLDDLNNEMHSIPGVVETGIFLNKMVSEVFVGFESGEVHSLFKQ